MKIDFEKDEQMSFYQMTIKYGLTIQEVLRQYAEYRASR